MGATLGTMTQSVYVLKNDDTRGLAQGLYLDYFEDFILRVRAWFHKYPSSYRHRTSTCRVRGFICSETYRPSEASLHMSCSWSGAFCS
jgi:hypothetical protein